MKKIKIEKLNKVSFWAAVLFFCWSCKEESKLPFSEINTIYDNSAVVEINIPKAEGNSTLSQAINQQLEHHMSRELNFGEDDQIISLEEAISNFNQAFSEFKTEFEESSLTWEATFDGEVIYHSDEIICIALSSYSFTGGAHGNMNITLFNFDRESGAILSRDELISDLKGFTDLVKIHFKKTVEEQGEDPSDYFFENDFELPVNIGFNDDGVLILYNTYEIASFANGITEFTIPFEDASVYLLKY